MTAVPTLHPTVPLTYLADVRPSGVDKHEGDGEQPVRLCNYTDVYYNEKITSDLDFMKATASPGEVERFALQPGDIAITKDSETADDIGIPAIVAEPLEDVVLGYHNALIRPRPEAVEPKFLFWVLASRAAAAYWETKARGVTRVGLRSDDVAALPVPMPDLETQRRVADMLDEETARIDTLIEKNNRALELLELRLQSAIEERIYRRASFQVRPLHTLCDPNRPIRYGIVLPGPHVDGGVPLIKGGDVHGHSLSHGTQSRVAVEIEKGHPQSRVCAGDILYAIRGSYGDVEVVPADLDGANITQDVARIAPSGVDARWLQYALRAPGTRAQAERASRGATISGVNIENLRSFRLPVPPPADQAAVAAELAAMEDAHVRLRDQVRRQQDLLSLRRRSLITAAVTGTIDV